MSSWTKASITTAIFALALAPAASAGTPFTVIAEPEASNGRVAVDRAGDAHVIWVSEHPTEREFSRLRYCKIPRTARACLSPRTIWPGPDSTVTFGLAEPRVFVTAANAVIVVATIRFDSTLPRGEAYMFRSSTPDGTFESGPTRIAPSGYLSGTHWPSAALGPPTASRADTVAFVNDANSKEYFEGPSSLTEGANLARNFSLMARGKHEVVASTPGGIRLVTSAGGSWPPGQVEFNRYDGSGDPNADGNWRGPFSAGPGDQVMVAGGPAGVVLASRVALGGSRLRPQFQARKYNGSTFRFGPGSAISDVGGPKFPDLFANAQTGQFHFIFKDADGDLRWTTSSDGVNWSRLHLIARDADLKASPADVAAGPDGTGMAVWNGNPGGGDPPDRITAVRLEPIPEGGGGGGTGGGGTGTGTGAGGSAGTGSGGTAGRSAPGGCSLLRIGTAGDDLIVGTPFGDLIRAGRGNDRVHGLAGDDCLSLSRGNDRGSGGSGRDRISGASGHDRLSGGSARDRLSGGRGNDRLSGGSGGDRLSGGRGRDRLNGGSANDRLKGNSGGDRITGGRGRDRVSAGSGNDRVRARDRFRDRVTCGRGYDRVRADRFDRVGRSCERVSRR